MKKIHQYSSLLWLLMIMTAYDGFSRQQQSVLTYKSYVGVLHGFNNSAFVMNDIYEYLKHQNFYAENISLYGHESGPESLENLKKSTMDIMVNDLTSKLDNVQKLAIKDNKPFYIVAYSFGALLSLNAILTNEIRPKKLFLLAPSLDIGYTKWLIKLARLFLPEDFLISTFSVSTSDRARFRAHDKFPIAAFSSLVDGIDKLDSSANKKINIPTEIMMSPKDSVVSFSGIQSFIKKHDLIQWKMKEIEPEGSMKHFIADKSNLGSASWNKLSQELSLFLTTQ